MKNIFDPAVAEEMIQRIRSLTPDSQPLWGKMDVARMLAHCCVPYEMVYEEKHPRPGAVKRFFLRTLVKPGVVNEKPYRRNSPTAPAFRIADERVFEEERERLMGYVQQTSELGETHFDRKDYPSFGPLTRTEWNNLFYKHLDHHLTQFGV
jgi:hypothetical protein